MIHYKKVMYCVLLTFQNCRNFLKFAIDMCNTFVDKAFGLDFKWKKAVWLIPYYPKYQFMAMSKVFALLT